MLSELVLRQVAVTLHARALTSPQVRPTDDPIVRSGSPDAVRVLLLGSGITSGWGVHTHGLALVGWLQHTLQERLHRPVDVEQVSAAGATLANAVDLLGDRATEEWDAIVVAFGLSDAMRLTPTREWAQALDRLLAKLDGDMPQGMLVPIVLVGVVPTETIGLMTPLASIFHRQPRRLNLLTEGAVEHNRRAVFAPLPEMADSSARPQGSSEAYRVWAQVIAEHLAPRIPAEVHRVSDEHTAMAPVGRLVAAAIDARNAAVRATMRRTAERLRADADADLALIGLIDGDRLWSVADSTGRPARSYVLPASFGEATMRDGFLHVSDAAGDLRLAGLSSALIHQFDSYAGVALRDAAGRSVGLICLFNGATGSGPGETLLRSVGSEVESHLALLHAADDAAPVFIARRDRTSSVPTSSTALGSPAAGHRAPSATEAAPTADTEASPTLRRGGGRRTRLRREGRRLATTPVSRPAPAEKDLRIQGADPIRVLLTGGEYSVGFGTTDRYESLDGAIARLLHIRTGRGVFVENRSRHLVPLEQLASSLGPAGAHTFDLVIWTPTFVEAARLLLRSRWIAGIGLMLRRIQTTSDAAVVLVGFPTLIGSQPLAVIGRARAATINRLLGRVAARHHRVLVVQPPAIVLKDVDVVSGAAVYQAAAVQILPAIMRLLGSEDLEESGPTEPAPGPRAHRDLVIA